MATSQYEKLLFGYQYLNSIGFDTVETSVGFSSGGARSTPAGRMVAECDMIRTERAQAGNRIADTRSRFG